MGSERVRAALKRNDLVLLVVANDRSERVKNKVERLARALSVPIISSASAAEIGGAVGRGPIQVIGIRDRKLAAGIRAATNGDVR
jgi:ribosomal protein L7Ae-like RNA K-turn-binding protein